MITLIIGKQSNLSEYLYKSMSNAVLLSSRELMLNIDILNVYKDKEINIIFNNFQSATLLNDSSNFSGYIEQSIGVTASILDYIKNWKINKVIYTSSSSIYGKNEYCNENDRVHPISLQASLKVSNELLITEYCKSYNIDYTIARIFNMYGGNDKFSIISKIIYAYKEKKLLNIINNGAGIRDFIHIDDVVYIILELIKTRNHKIINIGTGFKRSIKDILEFLTYNNFNVNTKNKIRTNEIEVSIADTKKLSTIMDKNFLKVEDYILNEIKSY
jgi:UDP-glucose 4-epimerase